MLIFLPESLRRIDVSLLPPLGPAAQKDHQPFFITTEVDSVARTEIQPQLLYASASALCGSEIASFKPIKRNHNSGLYTVVKFVEPSFKWIASLAVNVLANLHPN